MKSLAVSFVVSFISCKPIVLIYLFSADCLLSFVQKHNNKDCSPFSSTGFTGYISKCECLLLISLYPLQNDES